MPTALAIIPHPDDESYSFGGTLALLARGGWRCAIACASAGEAGERHDGGPDGTEALAKARAAELRASGAALGAGVVAMWGLPDGRLRGDDGAARVTAAIDTSKPDVVLALGADGAYGHPDHLAVYRWVTEALDARAVPVPALVTAFPRGLFLPQYELCRPLLGDPPELPPAAVGDDRFDLVVDIRAVAAAKLAAIAAHRTQLPGGDPQALFPPGIVRELLAVERFMVRGALPAELVRVLGGV